MNIFEIIFVQPLINALIFIYSILPYHDFGIAIILLTLIIRGVLWPLQSQTLRSQKALNKIQPEVKKIQEKYKNDPKKVQEMTMELYKEKEVNPLSSCLPSLIQLPLLFALFYALIKFRDPNFIKLINPNAGIWLYLYPWVRNLAFVKSALSVPFSTMFLGIIDLAKSAAPKGILSFGFYYWPAAILALLAGGTQYFQTKQIMPKQQGGDQAAKTMGMMVYLFPAMTIFIGVTLPAALPLYWTVTTAVAYFQQWLIMGRDVDELDKEAVIEVEAEEATTAKLLKTKNKKQKTKK